MVVCESSINNIMGGIENTGGVTLHNHRRKLKQRFDIIKKLGQGTYGKVQLGINKETGQEVAIKTIKKCKIETEADLVRIRREIQIMSSVQHPNIIHIYEVFENREKMVLVMEYAAGGELYDYLSNIKVFSEDEARRIFRQIATAVYYCHKHKICHRDLKLENILLDENQNAKIADFGLSNVFDEQRLLSTFCGSPLYASPEIVKGTPYHGPEVDCWSLGVLLYTLVYGAMPFDGSYFKRLVKQISQGDYFEPKVPSSASPLIREMLTVNPAKRATIEKVCKHWWVNATYSESCFDIAEELANQTPVRLDLLLSLAPPPHPVGSNQLVIAGESSSMAPAAKTTTPARSQSVGSLMELVPPAERRIRDLVSDENKSPKRKLEVTVSTENANLSNSGAKRKEKIPKEQKEEIVSEKKIDTNKVPINASVLNEQINENLPKKEEIVQSVNTDESMIDTDPNLQGAACKELIEESNLKNDLKEKKKTVKIVKKKTPSENIEVENKVVDNKENKTEPEEDKKEETKIPVKRKTVKKVLTDKTQNAATEKVEKPKVEEKINKEDKIVTAIEENKSKIEENSVAKPAVRRQSKIFETAEKFQNLLSNNESKSSVLEKPKKIFIPGVNVGGFKKEFERKASLTSPTIPDLKKVMSKKTVSANNQSPTDKSKTEETLPASNSAKSEIENNSQPLVQNEEPVQNVELIQKEPEPQNSEVITPVQNGNDKDEEKLKERKKNAVDIISNALKDGARKSKSRPCMIRKPPVPFGIHGRSASGSIGLLPQFSSCIAKTPDLPLPEEDNVKSSAEITLKSATLPRRKTTKAEIQLDYPPPKPATMEFKTEMAHRIEGKPELKTQRSEIVVPVNKPINRTSSLDPELKPIDSPRERIIPISFERDNDDKPEVSSPQTKPPTPKFFPTSRSVQPQRFGSISRQSTQESETETTISENMEPIRKSPREYIIPIAVEGGGYVTPRASSLEPSETGSAMSSGRRSLPRFGRTMRMGDNDSEDKLPFSLLHRHNSVERDSDNEDSRREPFHMHRLRSSRPTRKPTLEHADSLSSGEEDDDDGFEILTAENLFSTLLSRVRSLTQRLNVEDNGRLGFPNTRLLGNFDRGSKFWNLHNDALSSLQYSYSYSTESEIFTFSPLDRSMKQSSKSSLSSDRSGAPWRRSVSRDLASDIERVFNESPSATATLPRDKTKKLKEATKNDLDLSELKLSDEDALALSYLTPGLSRRIQNQLKLQLPPKKTNSRSTIRSKSKDPFSDSSDSELLSEYNFPRPKQSYSSRASDHSPISEIGTFEPKVENHGEPKIYRLEDIKREYSDDSKYTPFKNYYRSTSLVEPSTYKSPLYFRPVNFSSESFQPKYSEKPILSSTKYNTFNPRTYYLNTHPEETEDPLLFTKKSSRFGTPDYYDNCLYSKERKKREMETQKVLKEIRNKRINDSKDKFKSLDNNEDGKSTETSLSSECSLKDKSNDAKDAKIKREGKISKLIRPKSYPAECKKDVDNKSKTKNVKRSPSIEKSIPAKDSQNSDKKYSNNQFLNSIEKKIRSFYSDNQQNNDKAKNDVNSRIQSTIRSLREQSEPRNSENCITESGLIKRAVSSEDFSVFGTNKQNSKLLQPSRKSVSKILGLFKKYEDKDKTHSKNKSTEEKKNKNSVDGTKKSKTKSDGSSSKKSISNSDAKITSDSTKKSGSSLKTKSKLPISRGFSTEPEIVEKNQNILELDNAKYQKPERKDLKLNLIKKTTDFNVDLQDNGNISTFSPCEENNDSWSICSDLHRQDLSPCSENKLYSEDEGNESVSDRIRRKSFYCRFNEKKKPRRTSLSEYKNFELKYPEIATSRSKSSSRSAQNYDPSLHKSLSNSSYSCIPTKNDSKLYKRTLSANDNYYLYHPSKSSERFLDNDKSSGTKTKRSLLKTPTKITNRISLTPPLQDFELNSAPNHSVDISNQLL